MDRDVFENEQEKINILGEIARQLKIQNHLKAYELSGYSDQGEIEYIRDNIK